MLSWARIRVQAETPNTKTVVQAESESQIEDPIPESFVAESGKVGKNTQNLIMLIGIFYLNCLVGRCPCTVQMEDI